MVALYLILVLPLAWGAIRLTTPSVIFEMDFDTAHGTFTTILFPLVKAIWAVFWIGLLGGFAYQHFVGVGVAAEALVASGIYALLLNVWLLMAYERYLHQRYPRTGAMGISNYTASRYALTLALATATMATFISGVVMALQGMRA